MFTSSDEDNEEVATEARPSDPLLASIDSLAESDMCGAGTSITSAWPHTKH